MDIRLLNAPILDLQTTAALAPAVEKKFIRNCTDRELIRLVGSTDPRMYTPKNVIEVEVLSTVAAGGSGLPMAKFVAAIVGRRAEDRARQSDLGRRTNMRLMLYAMDISRSREIKPTPKMNVTLAEPVELSEKILDFTRSGREVRVLQADDIIEAFIDRYNALNP